MGEALLHGFGQLGDQLVNVGDDAGDALLVELDRLGDVVEDPQVVDDEAVRLGLAVGTVGAADRLQQRVVAQRLVEVHRLQDRRVEAGQELGGDDEDLEWVSGVAEAVEQLLLGVALAPVGRVVGPRRC